MTLNKNEVAKDISDNVKTVCKTIGKRNAGSEGERNAADYFAEKLSLCADDVKRENFNIFPKAYSGWIPFTVTCYLLAYAAYFFSSMVSIILCIVGSLMFICGYIINSQLFDSLYKKEVSKNVTAVKHCSSAPKKRIYFVANVDADYENNIKFRFGSATYIAMYIMDFAAMIILPVMAIVRWVFVGGVGAAIATDWQLYMGIAFAVFLIPLVSTYFTKNNNVVDGANVNLSGCFVALNVLNALKDVNLEDTEVGVIITGGGMAGIRGALNWCEKHGDVDKENTVFVSLKGLREVNALNANTYEMNGIVKSDAEVVKLITSSAEKCKIKCSASPIAHGITDSAAFVKAGYKSASISAVNRKLPDYYDTRYDSYDNLSDECLATVFELCVQIVVDYANIAD